MARYFDTESPEDLALILPAEMRKASEIQTTVDLVEDEILEKYTRRFDALTLAESYPDATVLTDTTDTAIMLKGYDNDPLLTESRLATALKRTVALVTSWRIRYHRRDPAVHSQHTTEGKFTRWNASASDEFPQDWSRFLRQFDLRDPGSYL